MLRYLGPLCGMGASPALKGALDSSSFALGSEFSAGEAFTPEAFLLREKRHPTAVATVAAMAPMIIADMMITPSDAALPLSDYRRTVTLLRVTLYVNPGRERMAAKH